VIAEFFGTKPPTIEELQAREKYLEETETVEENIRQLETKRKGKSLIERGKEKVIELATARQEIAKALDNHEESEQETIGQLEAAAEESQPIPFRKPQSNEVESQPVLSEENVPSWLATSGSTVPLQTVVEHTQLSIRKLRNRVESRQIRATKNKDIVYKNSLIAWMKTEGILQESPTQGESNAAGTERETDAMTVLSIVHTDEETNGQNGHKPVVM
jgi:hypothetical protein